MVLLELWILQALGDWHPSPRVGFPIRARHRGSPGPREAWPGARWLDCETQAAVHEAPELQAERGLAPPGQRLPVAPTPHPDSMLAEDHRRSLRPTLPYKPPLLFVPLLPAVFTLCLFLSHLFSLFFQKRKSSSSVQLMVSVCRLPNAGKCWASDPRSCLPPAGCTGNPGRGEGAQGVLGTCASCDNMCVVCACCWRVSVDTSNSTAQTSSGQ